MGDYAVEQMNELEHYEDNLNNNLSNKLALDRFITVAKKVRANLNDKYDIGFIDPGVEGDCSERAGGDLTAPTASWISPRSFNNDIPKKLISEPELVLLTAATSSA